MTASRQRTAVGAVSSGVQNRAAWTVVALLFSFMLINFADKVVLGLAAVPIMAELTLTPSQFGLLASGFFFLFSISAVITGFIVNRVASRWAILVMGVVWAVAQFPMLGAAGFGVLMASRIALGAGEGPAYPVALHAVYKWFPNERRAMPTAVVVLGSGIGLIVAPPILNFVITRASWHWAFGTLGIVGMVWVLAWLGLGEERDAEEPAGPEKSSPVARVPYARLLLNATTLATFACGFGHYWILSLLLSWFTPYLVVGLGLTQGQAGWLTSLPAIAIVLWVGVAAWVSQWALARGATTRMARGLLGGGAVTAGGIAMMLVPQVEASVVKVALIVLGIALPTVISVLSPPMISEFTPVRQRGAMLAITNAVLTLAGIIAPYLMGRVVEVGRSAAEGYEHGFVISGCVAFVGGVIGMVFLRPETELARFSAPARIVPARSTA